MKAGEHIEYLWEDGMNFKKPTRVTASHYVVLLMNWIEILLNSEKYFPSNAKFSENFKTVVKTIFKRLFRVYAHIYCYHYQECKILGIEKHLNSVFQHFIFFVQEFNLMNQKEMNVLKKEIQELNQ
jgi:MOB kinase activator 1